MPSYLCTTTIGHLTAEQRSRIARVITSAHHEVTGAPVAFVRVAFEEVASEAVFVAGAPLEHAHVFVHGSIRDGRDARTRAELISRIAVGVCDAAHLDRRGLWIYLVELSADNMVEFGHGLPAAGEEAAWRDALPDADRAWMDQLGT